MLLLLMLLLLLLLLLQVAPVIQEKFCSPDQSPLQCCCCCCCCKLLNCVQLKLQNNVVEHVLFAIVALIYICQSYFCQAIVAIVDNCRIVVLLLLNVSFVFVGKVREDKAPAGKWPALLFLQFGQPAFYPFLPFYPFYPLKGHLSYGML